MRIGTGARRSGAAAGGAIVLVVGLLAVGVGGAAAQPKGSPPSAEAASSPPAAAAEAAPRRAAAPPRPGTVTHAGLLRPGSLDTALQAPDGEFVFEFATAAPGARRVFEVCRSDEPCEVVARLGPTGDVAAIVGARRLARLPSGPAGGRGLGGAGTSGRGG